MKAEDKSSNVSIDGRALLALLVMAGLLSEDCHWIFLVDSQFYRLEQCVLNEKIRKSGYEEKFEIFFNRYHQKDHKDREKRRENPNEQNRSDLFLFKIQ